MLSNVFILKMFPLVFSGS